MSQVVEERDLDFNQFHCCGDEDLYPFGCPCCGRLMVFCYECDTLYADLHRLDLTGWPVNHFDTSRPIFNCAGCGFEFEYFFYQDGKYKTTRDQWQRAGFAHLVKSSQPLTAVVTDRACLVTISGEQVDLNAGMIEAVTNPPQGFASKHSFTETDMVSRVGAVDWFAHCGEPLTLDLSMETEQVRDWPAAIDSCKKPNWENTELEAQNQLTLWLHLNDRVNYRKWNNIVRTHKTSIVNSLTDSFLKPFQTQHGLDIVFVHSVQWDILGALMENSYLRSGHRAFFFLELFLVYEAGHFPCGWIGDWPQGKLRLY